MLCSVQIQTLRKFCPAYRSLFIEDKVAWNNTTVKMCIQDAHIEQRKSLSWSRDLMLNCRSVRTIGIFPEHMTLEVRKSAYNSFQNFLETAELLLLRGLSPRANYTDRAAAAGRRS